MIEECFLRRRLPSIAVFSKTVPHFFWGAETWMLRSAKILSPSFPLAQIEEMEMPSVPKRGIFGDNPLYVFIVPI